jgi:hypothetical protein
MPSPCLHAEVQSIICFGLSADLCLFWGAGTQAWPLWFNRLQINGIPEESIEVDFRALVEDNTLYFKETSLNNMVIIARS